MAMMGNLKRSIEVIKDETLKMAGFGNPLFNWTKEMKMLNVNSQEDLQKWIVGCDRDIGGKSEVNWELTPEAYGKLHGYIRNEIPGNDPGRPICGYAGIKSKNESNIMGLKVWDTALFRYLMLRVRGDRRRYFVNIQTDSANRKTLWQHRLFLRRPGTWEVHMIPFKDFVVTNQGIPEHPQIRMLRERVKTVGFSLLDRQEGPFSLEIDYIKAMNTDRSQGDYDRPNRPESGFFF
ncbi:hypothetical protein G9A89_015403 [Geosiphon pyriformis]|nr:hypothetical protein G9A89_015403 [Geosiphon pyriformis]